MTYCANRGCGYIQHTHAGVALEGSNGWAMISSKIIKSWQNMGGVSMKTQKLCLKINIMLIDKRIMSKKAKISTPQ